jgi:adenine-specific DNA methylase
MKLISQASAEKLRGGFYTPPIIADFILRWALTDGNRADILEPSCGDGVFLKQLKKNRFNYESLKAVELDTIEYEKSSVLTLDFENTTVTNCDFLEYCNNTNERFDVVIGNPPYIRYQFFDKKQQIEAEKIFISAKLKFSKLTNIWVPFVIGSSLLLKREGKIGFVLPAEILQVSYAKELRNFLAHFYNKISIISFEKLVFPDIQQEVVLLLCEKNNSMEHSINHLELKDAEDLPNLEIDSLYKNRKLIDFNNNKWTFYFLEQEEIDFLENIVEKYKLPKIGDYANIEVGITTGSNSFFTVDKNTVFQYGMQDYAKPMVGRSVQVNSLVFTNNDWLENVNNGSRAYLLTFPENQEIINGARFYIEIGESMDIHKGYKTGIRDKWYVVPSLKKSVALFVRRNHLYPKLVINEVAAYTTDTMHRVFIKDKTNMNAFVASYYNSLTFAFTEVCGRSHGGGVLELMPNEVESVVLPYNVSNEDLVHKIDKMIRKKTNIEEILEYTNKKILSENLGLSEQEIMTAHSIWKKLMNRRLNRG